MLTRTDHMAAVKQQALAQCDKGDVHEALATLLAALDRHPETKDHRGITTAMTLALAGQLRTMEQMRTFIEGLH